MLRTNPTPASTEQGRRETLSPIPRSANTVWSAIEIAAEDLTSEEQRITDKCQEVDFQLSTHRDWAKPHPRLHEDLLTLILILYETAFNTNGFQT